MTHLYLGSYLDCQPVEIIEKERKKVCSNKNCASFHIETFHDYKYCPDCGSKIEKQIFEQKGYDYIDNLKLFEKHGLDWSNSDLRHTLSYSKVFYFVDPDCEDVPRKFSCLESNVEDYDVFGEKDFQNIEQEKQWFVEKFAKVIDVLSDAYGGKDKCFVKWGLLWEIL